MSHRAQRAFRPLRRARQLFEFLIEDIAGIAADARYTVVHALRRLLHS